MKRELRTRSVGTKVSEAELRVLESRAAAAGLTLSEWVRDVLLGSSVDAGTLAAENNPSSYPPALPTQRFEFDASSAAGAGNGDAATNYGSIYSYLIPAGGYALNGNILAHSDSVMGDWAFQYDTLNRLTVAAPAINAPSTYQKTVGCFSYDSFGNRTTDAYVTLSDCTTATETAKYNSVNQVTFVSQGTPVSYSAPSGFKYDAAGDVTFDGSNTYAYDGDGRLCAVYDGLQGLYTRYVYDAAGRRVAKVGLTWLGSGTGISSLSTACATQASNASWTFAPSALFLLDLNGDQVTELTGTGAWKHSNVWAGAHLDATFDSCGLHFHIADPLGTRRVQANGSGVVEESIQSLPFGDNLVEVAGSASCTEDATEHHFTGKERDSESGNDYFGARYFGSSMGRFMTPDPSGLLAQHAADPQSWNLYAYARNNPLKYLDPDGLDCIYATDDGKGVESIDHDSSAGECKDSQGTWVPGTVTEDHWAYNPNNGQIQAASYDGGKVDYATFKAGAVTDADGSCQSGCGGYQFASANAAWLASMDHGASLGDMMSFMVNRFAPIHGTVIPGALGRILEQILSGPLDFWNDHWAGPSGMGAPHGQNDWAAMAHDYNLDYAGPDSYSRVTQLLCCLLPTRKGVGILIFRLFEAQ
jgi:RHS repeat-associated protein